MAEINNLDKVIEDFGERILEYDSELKEVLDMVKKIVELLNKVKYIDVRSIILSNALDHIMSEVIMSPALKVGILENVKSRILLDTTIADILASPLFNQYLQSKRDNI